MTEESEQQTGTFPLAWFLPPPLHLGAWPKMTWSCSVETGFPFRCCLRCMLRLILDDYETANNMPTRLLLHRQPNAPSVWLHPSSLGPFSLCF